MAILDATPLIQRCLDSSKERAGSGTAPAVLDNAAFEVMKRFQLVYCIKLTAAGSL